jgi:pSer/pThr/pTyr-binding forkhead associated (FHA) protein
MKLIIEDDEGRTTVVPVARDEITIGRNDANIVRLGEKDVSRHHGRLVRESGHYYIEDLNSFTGIRVNGEKITGKRLLHDGDLIQISEYDLILQEGPEERPPLPFAGIAETPILPQEVAAPPPPPPIADADAKARRTAETATIRLSDLRTEQVEVPPQEVPESQRAKLVGISGKHRGEELLLDRSPIRLGRSEENDLRIEHPSISRKHLRLHLDNGTWKVMDAESRNGVRVNGEPYAQIGLRHGDVVEVGHLRYAFVERGRPFHLPPELTPLAPSMLASPPARTGLWVGIGMASVALLAVSIFLILRNRADAEIAQRLRAQRESALRIADESGAAHRYSEALQGLDAARRLGADASDLKAYDAVEREARSEDLYRDMEGALAAQDWDRARRLLDALSATQTFYGGKAAEKADAITAGYVNARVATAARLRGQDNAGCLAEAQLALAVNPQSAEARALADACKHPSVQTTAAAPSRSARTSPARATAQEVPRAYDEAEARRLLNEGNQKLVGQDLSGAIVLYQKALTLKPGKTILAGLYRSMGIAFTRQGNMEEGAHYYRLYLPLCPNSTEKAQLQKVLEDYDARRR